MTEHLPPEHAQRRLPGWLNAANARVAAVLATVALVIVGANIALTGWGNATAANRVLTEQLEDAGIEPAVEVRQGAIGPRGLRGDDGEPGPRGPQGAQGPQGRQGPQGIPGLMGAQGIPGVPGPICSTGPPGPAGQQGVPGAGGTDGEPGQPGKDGAPGEPGKDGAKGDPGDKGRSIVTGPTCVNDDTEDGSHWVTTYDQPPLEETQPGPCRIEPTPAPTEGPSPDPLLPGLPAKTGD